MTVQDGDEVELILRPIKDPDDPDQDHAAMIERTVKGIVRSFQTEARFDPVTGEQTIYPETRWEVVTGDPVYPAIGFDPDTAQFK